MRERFIDRKFQKATLAEIDKANEIIGEYADQGFTLTLRQLFYQFVARDIIKNTQTEYKRLGSVINTARLAGEIDWDSIEDRTRNVRIVSTWDSPADVIDAAASGYKEDLWRGQLFRPQVWIEKDALIGVIEPACERYRIPYFACRGNNSQSEQYKSGKLFEEQHQDGLFPVVLHLGDHDPNGLDMTRDNRDRLTMFARHHVEVRRIALNMDQVEQYRPPPNPAKETDTRFKSYTEQFGAMSWELDALNPPVIDALISAEIETMLDRDNWNAAKAQETERRQALLDASDRWSDVEAFLAEALQ